MKSVILALALILLVPTLLKAQWYEALRDVGPPTTWQRTQHYVRNTGSGGVPLRLMWEVRDTAFFKIWSDSLIVNQLGSTNHGYPSGNLLWTDAIGTFRSTPLSSMFFADSSVVATRSWVNSRGFLTSYTETDPIWTADKTNYYTKTQSDARYLQSFTEVDPVWTAAIPNYYTKTNLQTSGQAAVHWGNITNTPTTVAGYGITDVYTKTQSDARYLQSYSETDPLFDTKFAAKSTTNLTEGTNLYYTAARFNTAFSAKSTTDLTEGTNLYYTAARFNTAFAAKTTTDLAEGTNQYFTTARARLALSAGTGISYNNSSGVITNSSPDQTVVLSNGTGISATGTYPNFTITNTSPDQTVVLNNGTGISNTGTYPNFTITNTAPDQTVSIASGTGISVTGTYPSFTVTNTGLSNPTPSTPARTLSTTGANNTFTISASRPSWVTYTINIAFALTLVTSNGLVDLDYSTNGGSSWVPVASVSNAYTVAVTLAGNTNSVLAGFIPANALVRINRVSNSNVTISIVRQQETTL